MAASSHSLSSSLSPASAFAQSYADRVFRNALKTITQNGAYLTFDDDIRGSLETGKLADLVILDSDLMNAPPEALLTMSDNVLLTMVGGKTAYRKTGFELN